MFPGAPAHRLDSLWSNLRKAPPAAEGGLAEGEGSRGLLGLGPGRVHACSSSCSGELAAWGGSAGGGSGSLGSLVGTQQPPPIESSPHDPASPRHPTQQPGKPGSGAWVPQWWAGGRCCWTSEPVSLAGVRAVPSGRAGSRAEPSEMFDSTHQRTWPLHRPRREHRGRELPQMAALCPWGASCSW